MSADLQQRRKGKAKRTAKRPDKRSDSRCTPLKFRKIYDILSPEKKALIDEMELEAFQHLPNFYINHKVLIELVRSYDIFTNTISTSVGEFLITFEKVGHAFGLNCRDLFEKKQKGFEDKLNAEEKQALDLFKGKSLTFKSFLLPTSSAYISPVHLPVIRDIDNTHDRNWVHHVNSFLINGIKEFHDQGSQAVKGCHFVLMIIYFKQRYDGKSLNDPNAPTPWIERWTGKKIKEKIKAEDEDITGLIQRTKMRAQKQKTDKKRTESEDENPEDDVDSMESDIEEEEYHTTDSETESDFEEVQRERKSKRKEKESVIATNHAHDATIPETGPEHEPVRQFGLELEPEPEPVMQPEPEPEPVILVGPEPQEVIDGFVAACEQVEETKAAIKACEEAEVRYQQINQSEMEKDNEAEAEIRRIIEVVITDVRELQE
ncbi:hypothetical protein PIB30_076108 [Stylosanthes scabra]|uniref:Uncharacterized protein n=1 Tax=Stylosanthes scabra TaxID=79078 RepID=A0ABU6QPW6_9FABA|nr:hypothetical protein [Stylosanthes scabra]